jgi:hypothetical protein
VLRRFRRNTDRKRIAFQLDVQEHLAARGIPTCRSPSEGAAKAAEIALYDFESESSGHGTRAGS